MGFGVVSGRDILIFLSARLYLLTVVSFHVCSFSLVDWMMGVPSVGGGFFLVSSLSYLFIFLMFLYVCNDKKQICDGGT